MKIDEDKWKCFEHFNPIYDEPTKEPLFNELLKFVNCEDFHSAFMNVQDEATVYLYCELTFLCIYLIETKKFQTQDKNTIKFCIELINAHDNGNIIMAASILASLKFK